MKVLFIGGTGIISSACSELAVERGIDLYLLNRGRSQRPVPAGAHVLKGDIRNGSTIRDILAAHTFDVVADFVAYTPDQVQADIDLLRGRVGQYIFISSASTYQKPPASLPITESTVLSNPYWQYSRNKIAGEDLLLQAYRNTGFPVTIVRPSHTYDKMSPPIQGGYTAIDRMRRGKQIVIHGDGTSLWVVTHHKDVAKGFVGLLGNPHALGESFHITSEEYLTWDQIHHILARAAGVEARIVHVPSDYIRALDPAWGDGLVGDKAHSLIFDNTKIKRFVPGFAATIPFARGAEEIMAWYDGAAERRIIEPEFDQLCDRIIATFASIWPAAG